MPSYIYIVRCIRPSSVVSCICGDDSLFRHHLRLLWLRPLHWWRLPHENCRGEGLHGQRGCRQLRAGRAGHLIQTRGSWSRYVKQKNYQSENVNIFNREAWDDNEIETTRRRILMMIYPVWSVKREMGTADTRLGKREVILLLELSYFITNWGF